MGNTGTSAGTRNRHGRSCATVDWRCQIQIHLAAGISQLLRAGLCEDCVDPGSGTNPRYEDSLPHSNQGSGRGQACANQVSYLLDVCRFLYWLDTTYRKPVSYTHLTLPTSDLV